MYRAPTLLTPTQGERPQTVAAASTEVAFPSKTAEPGFPIQALSGGVVLIEARISPTGVVTPRVVTSRPPFDSAAMQTAQQWGFYPASGSAESYAYIVFGFQPPLTGR